MDALEEGQAIAAFQKETAFKQSVKHEERVSNQKIFKRVILPFSCDKAGSSDGLRVVATWARRRQG